MEKLIEQIITDPDFPAGIAWSRKDYPANTTVIREGDTGETLYMIESGAVRVTARVALDNSRHIQPGLSDLQAGDIFGELCLVSQEKRSATVTTLSDCSLVEIDANQLNDYLEKHSDVGYQFLKKLFQRVVKRLHTANQRLEHLFSWGLKAHGIDKEL